jgi:hypothetical protein
MGLKTKNKYQIKNNLHIIILKSHIYMYNKKINN